MIELHVGGPGPGRSFGWRATMLFFGVGLTLAGLLVIFWPAIIAYAVGGALCTVGVFLVATGLAARGR